MGRTRARAAAVLLAGLTAPLLALPAYAADGDLTVARPSPTAAGGLRVGVTLPPALSVRPLAPGALTAVQDGRPVPVRTSRVVDGPLEVVVALDASEGPRALAEEQSAAADLLRALPADTPTTVLPGGRTAPALEALALVEQATAGPGGLLEGLPPAGTAPRAVVVLTGCPALSEADQQVAALQASVSLLVRQVDCGAVMTATTGSDPGVVRTGLDGAGLVAGADEVARSLLGRYDVALGGPLSAAPVELSLTTGGTVATGTVLPPQSAAAPPASDPPASDPPASDPPAAAAPDPAAPPATAPDPQAAPSLSSPAGNGVDGRLLLIAALLAVAPFAYVLAGLRRRGPRQAATG